MTTIIIKYLILILSLFIVVSTSILVFRQKKITRHLITYLFLLLAFSFSFGYFFESLQVFRNIKESISPFNNTRRIQNLLGYAKETHCIGYVTIINNHHVRLDLLNLSTYPIIVEGIEYNEQLIVSSSHFILPTENIPVKYKQIDIIDFSREFKNDPQNMTVSIKYSLSNDSNRASLKQKLFPWSIFDRGMIERELLEASDLKNQPFIKIDENKKTIYLLPGLWEVRNPVVFPTGYRVIGEKGTTFDLQNGAFFVFYSPIYLGGTKGDPIKFYSSDRSGRGMLILNTNNRSEMHHVIFKHLNNFVYGSWKLSGAVTFYESDVLIDSCSFVSNLQGDDFLNIIRSNFTLKDSLFLNVFADAFDSDFSTGTINSSNFINCGNDGIDMSGTTASINHTYFESIADKALSIGERSLLHINNITITASEIAVTAKDNSRLVGQGLSINNSKLGFAVFKKKSEYGPGFVQIDNFEMNNVQEMYLLEKYSTLIINGVEQERNVKKVKNNLYGKDYGKKSK
jgi:hypothetical protein